MYLVQRGEDRKGGDGYRPRFIANLPNDVSLVEGEWRYSESLPGWVGYDLPEVENIRLYKGRIEKA